MTDFTAPQFCIGFDGEEQPVVWGDCDPSPVVVRLPRRRAKKVAAQGQPKPRNWREYFGYRPSRSLKWSRGPREVRAMEAAYVQWLAKARGWSTAEVREYCANMDRRTLISATHLTADRLATNRLAA